MKSEREWQLQSLELAGENESALRLATEIAADHSSQLAQAAAACHPRDFREARVAWLHAHDILRRVRCSRALAACLFGGLLIGVALCTLRFEIVATLAFWGAVLLHHACKAYLRL